MKEHIHIKINASDKQELSNKAKDLGLSLSSYLRMTLKQSTVVKEIILREV